MDTLITREGLLDMGATESWGPLGYDYKIFFSEKIKGVYRNRS